MKIASVIAMTCFLALFGLQTAGAGQSEEHADRRIAAWHALMKSQSHATPQAKVAAVNRFFNGQIQYRSDEEVYGQLEYWATSQETLLKGFGDCDDYAIAKFQTLRKLGLPSNQLRLVHVVTSAKQQHLVLVYNPEPRRGYVLDNLTDEIIATGQRMDLTPIYSFNDQWIWTGKSNKPLRASSSLKRWSDVQSRMVAAI